MNPFLNTVSNQIQTDTELANNQANTLTANYSDIYNRAGNIGLDQTVINNLRGLNRSNSNALNAASSGGSGGGGGSDSGGGGGSVTPTDAFGSSRAAFANFINTGGVDIGAMKEALPGFRKLAESGGYSPEEKKAIEDLAGRLAAIGETGGYDPETLNKINSNINVLSSIGQTGGFDQPTLDLIRGDLAGLRTIGQTGGVSDADINRVRGYGVFENFANTGGYSDADIQNVRSRAISPIGSLYSRDLAEAERSNRLMGTAAPNYAATLARMSRNRGMNLADATREAELGLQDQIRQNKLSGASAGSQAELSLQDLLTKNKISGLSGAAEGEANLADAIAKNKMTGATNASTQLQNLQNAITEAKLSGNKEAANILGNLYNSIATTQINALGGITDTQQGAEEIAQRGKIAGAEGMFGVEQATEAARQADAARSAYESAVSAQQRAADEQFWAEFNAGNERWIGEQMLGAQGMGLEGQLGAMSGLSSLYGTAPGARGQSYQAFLEGALGRNAGANQNIGIQQQNVGPSFLQQIAGLAAPVAGAFVGGIPRTSGTPGPSSLGGISTVPQNMPRYGMSNIGSYYTLPTYGGR